MIKKLLILPFILLSITSYAQRDGDAKYSFGVRGYNYLQLPRLLNQAGGNRYTTSNFSSYMVKFNENLFSYRLNGSYFNQATSFNNDCTNCGLAEGKLKDYSFKMGFEKNFTYSAIQPYLALDLGYRSNEFNGTLSPADSQRLNISTRKRGFTVTPVFGIKLSPIKQVSIFAETNLELFYAWGKTNSDGQVDPEVRSQQYFKKGEFLYNPVAVGIQIHLGQKN